MMTNSWVVLLGGLFFGMGLAFVFVLIMDMYFKYSEKKYRRRMLDVHKYKVIVNNKGQYGFETPSGSRFGCYETVFGTQKAIGQLPRAKASGLADCFRKPCTGN